MKTTRRKIGDLMVEITLPERTSRGILLMLPGLPQLQHKHALSQELATRGWEIWSPQLSGSWDSAGAFSPDTHIQDIQLLVAEAPELKAIVGYSYSAGIAVAYAAASGTTIPIVLIGAILDFKALKDEADSLLEYLAGFYPLTYRIDNENLRTYLIGESHISLENASKLPPKILILVGTQDKNHNETAIAAFAKSTDAIVKKFTCTHSLEDFAKQSGLYEAIETHLS